VNPPEKIKFLFRKPPLTRARMIIALVIAMFADGLQLILGPFGWAFGDQIIDVVAMILISRVIGFHWLLLPTFVTEFIPLLDDLPTWTACTLTVVVLRKREQRAAPPKISPDKPAIEI
jgi:hypothetical protein